MLKVVTNNNIYFSNTIFYLTFIKMWLIVIEKNKHCYWIKIYERPEYNFFYNIEDLSIGFFWYHSKLHQEEPLGYVVFTFPHVRGTFWLCCVQNCQLMTHPAVFSFFKSWCIARLYNTNLGWHRSKGFPDWGWSKRNLSFSR